MKTREKVQLGLFLTVLVGTLMAQAASTAHLFEAFGWANSLLMAYVMAGVTVVLSAVFVALAVISPAGRVRTAIMVGIMLLGITEWFANMTLGWLLVRERMPQSVSVLFNLEPGVTERVGAFLTSGLIPVLTFIAVYAIAETGKKFLEDPPANALAEDKLRRMAGRWSDVPREDDQLAVHRNGGNQ